MTSADLSPLPTSSPLCPDVARTIFQRWGIHLVDLLVIKQNRKCQQFCILHRHSLGSLRFLPAPWHIFPHFSCAQSQAGQSEGYFYNPSVAIPALVWHITGPVSSDPNATPFPPRPDLARSQLIAPLKSQGPLPDCVKAPWLNPAELDSLEKVCQIFLGSRKPSTRETYLAKWKHISVWSSPRGLSSLC